MSKSDTFILITPFVRNTFKNQISLEQKICNNRRVGKLIPNFRLPLHMLTASFSNIEQTIIANIRKADESLKIAVAWFTNPNLYSLLQELIDADRRIELILADDEINFTNSTCNFQQLIDQGIGIWVRRFSNLMHHKFCIVDDNLLITGSYNWTKSAEVFNHENIIITDEPAVVTKFLGEFMELKNKTVKLHSVSTTTFERYAEKYIMETEQSLITATLGNGIQGQSKILKSNIDDEEIQGKLKEAQFLYLQGKHEDAIRCSKSRDVFKEKGYQLILTLC